MDHATLVAAMRDPSFYEPPVGGVDERFRCGDIAVDLAFLAMDLDSRDRPDLASHLIERYVEACGDAGLVDVLDLYKCYRAYVRGKISGFTSSGETMRTSMMTW